MKILFFVSITEDLKTLFYFNFEHGNCAPHGARRKPFGCKLKLRDNEEFMRS